MTTTLQALFMGALGVWCYGLALRVYAAAAQQHRWHSTWLRRLPGLRGTVVGAAPGEIVCVEGRAGPALGPALVCPVFRVTCVAFWLWVHSGLLGRVTYRRSQAVRFWLDGVADRTVGGGRVLVDPAAVGLVELDRALDTGRDGNSRHDPDLESHLELAAMLDGRAASLGVLHGRLEPGQTCTVVGPVVHAEAGASPYRQPLASIIGGDGPLYIAAISRAGLLCRLRRRRALSTAIMVAAGALLGSGAVLVGAALLREPWLSFVGVPALMGLAGARRS